MAQAAGARGSSGTGKPFARAPGPRRTAPSGSQAARSCARSTVSGRTSCPPRTAQAYSSPRRASSVGTRSSEGRRADRARASRLEAPATGSLRAYESAFTAARPTRSPVNEPGPTPAASASMESSGASASSASGSTSPALCACSDPATARPSSHSAQLSRGDELSSARTRKALLEEFPHRVVAQGEQHEPEHQRDPDHVGDLPEAQRQRPAADALDAGGEDVEAVQHRQRDQVHQAQ